MLKLDDGLITDLKSALVSCLSPEDPLFESIRLLGRRAADGRAEAEFADAMLCLTPNQVQALMVLPATFVQTIHNYLSIGYSTWLSAYSPSHKQRYVTGQILEAMLIPNLLPFFDMRGAPDVWPDNAPDPPVGERRRAIVPVLSNDKVVIHLTSWKMARSSSGEMALYYADAIMAEVNGSFVCCVPDGRCLIGTIAEIFDAYANGVVVRPVPCAQ